MSNMVLSANGLAELKLAEALVLKLYNDSAGHCTIGYGHLVHHDPCGGKKYLNEHQFIHGVTVTRATVLLKQDIARFEKEVNASVNVPLTQHQFDALVIFAFNPSRYGLTAAFRFNVGVNAFKKSTLLKHINGNDFGAIPAEFRRWNKSKGKMMLGLANRREREIRLFEKK